MIYIQVHISMGMKMSQRKKYIGKTCTPVEHGTRNTKKKSRKANSGTTEFVYESTENNLNWIVL